MKKLRRLNYEVKFTATIEALGINTLLRFYNNVDALPSIFQVKLVFTGRRRYYLALV